ncbi:MAG TPA: FkbM family methyltransferase [Candidatus Acidoferrum sp.]|jgi:FkbM family methyltransferase|nr:FkbM family methyltransferase [Candidatus Acidoferrum sp.]
MKAVRLLVPEALRQATLYQRAKASLLYEIYCNLCNRRIIEERSSEVQFYRRVLKGFKEGDLIFDIGANYGRKTDVFLRLGARVVAVDPDESNQKALEGQFLRYRFSRKPVTVIGKAVSDKEAVATMWMHEPGCAKNTLSPKWVDTLKSDGERFGGTLEFPLRKEIQTITVEQLMANHGVPFFIKVDVEGHELSVIRGMRRSVPYLSFEVNLPEFAQEGRECITKLDQLAKDGVFNCFTDFQRGMVLDQWLGRREFLQIFDDCKEKSIEIFWKAPRQTA